MIHPLVAEELARSLFNRPNDAAMPWVLPAECKLKVGRTDDPALCFYCDKPVHH